MAFFRMPQTPRRNPPASETAESPPRVRTEVRFLRIPETETLPDAPARAVSLPPLALAPAILLAPADRMGIRRPHP